MSYREDQLNGRIASAINRIASASGWFAREELKGALRPRPEKRGGGKRVQGTTGHLGIARRRATDHS